LIPVAVNTVVFPVHVSNARTEQGVADAMTDRGHKAQITNGNIALIGPRGSAVELQSLASVLSQSCAQPVADG